MHRRKAPLGPLQPIYDVWTDAQEEVRKKPHQEFDCLIEGQVGEVWDALSEGNLEHASLEVVDIISVCLNWLRRIGWSDQEIAALFLVRAFDYRRKGGGRAILEKYEREKRL